MMLRGEVAPGVFRFIQKDTRVVVGGPLFTIVDGVPAEPEPRDVVLNVHVFTHRGDAAVSGRLYLLEGDGSTGDTRLANADGVTTQQIMHTSTLGVPAEVGFSEAIRMAIAALRDHEVSLFEASDPDGARALAEAFVEAEAKIFEDVDEDGE